MHVYDETLGDHYDWEIDLSALTAALRMEEGVDEWVILRTHPIRSAASGWEYYESPDQHAERVANLEAAVQDLALAPIESYPTSTRDLELARRQRVIDALQSARDQGPGWRKFGAQVSAEISDARRP